MAFCKQAYLVAGLSGGFLTHVMSTFMLLAWISFHLSRKSVVVGSFRYVRFTANYFLFL